MALWNLYNPPDLLYEVLEPDFEDLKQDPVSPRKALHCLVVGWHLTDWTFKSYGYKTSMSLGEYRESLYPRCPELQVLHDLATELKHFTVNRPKLEVKTRLQPGAFSSAFSPGFDIGTLVLHYQGKSVNVLQVIEAVIRFWNSYFDELRKSGLL